MIGISNFPGQSKTMGCLAYVQISDIRRPKLDHKANMCIFFSFAEDSDACRFLNIDTNSIIEARDESFMRTSLVRIKAYRLEMYLKN